MVLRDLTDRTGAIHELQAMNLRAWAKLCVPKASEVVLTIRSPEWSLDPVNPQVRMCHTMGLVHLDVTAPKRTRVQLEVLAGLKRSVDWLLGPEWDLELVVNGKVVR